jgi:hypothetical protein
MFEPTPLTTDLTGIFEGPLLAHIVATLTLAVGLIGIRVLSGWLLGRLDAVKRRSRRRWLVRVRNATVLLVAIGFAVIGLDQIL